MSQEDPRVLELRAIREKTRAGGGEARIARQHEKGKLTARERLNLAARGRDLWRSAAQRRGAARLSELFAGARPGAVVIVAQVWAMEWVRLADTSGLRVVGMSHESFAATRGSSRYRRVKEHYAGVDRFLVLTQEDADAWARDGMTNVDHIPNALHVVPGVLPTLDLPVVASVGRLSHEKGLGADGPAPPRLAAARLRRRA